MGIAAPRALKHSSEEIAWYGWERLRSARGGLPIIVIVATWVLIAILINPRGNFPLHDDWAYGGAVKTLLQTGSIRLPDWSSPNLVAQLWWGALFCVPSGFSFTALRISTIVLGLIGVLAAFGIFRGIGATPGVALFGALTLAVNPLYLVLSYTFMTDVPFVVCSLVSLYFLVKAAKTDSNLQMIVGLLFACVAILIRQTGMALFLAAGLAYLAKNGLRARTGLTAASLVLPGFAVQILFQEWLKLTHRTPALYQYQTSILLKFSSYMTWRSVKPLAGGCIVFFVYLGLFALPVVILLGWRNWLNLFRSRHLAPVTFVFAAAVVYFLPGRTMPLLPNFLYNLGLGPSYVLYDIVTRHLRHWPAAGEGFWTAVTVAGAVGAVFVFQAMLVSIVRVFERGVAPPGTKAGIALLLATGAIYVAPLFVLWLTTGVFDRYLLLLVPLVIVLLVQSSAAPDLAKANPRFVSIALVVLLLYGAFSVAGTHDYLSWNRARWKALNSLMREQHVPPTDIDGGFEFNGLYLSQGGRTPQSGGQKSWWWVAGDDFVAAFGPVPGFTELKRYQFRRWLPPGEGSILILRRTTAASH
jgi:Dolichyl-phosphate-mannose-protein mannosyltransferase